MTSLLTFVFATAVFVTHFPAHGLSKPTNLRLDIDEERPQGTIVVNMVDIFGLLPEERSGRHFKLLEQQLKSSAGSRQPRHGLVTVDQATGIIKLRRKVDRDHLCGTADVCLLKVQAVMLPQSFFSLLNLEIVINDINDNSPIFLTNPIAVNVSESADIGDVIPLHQYQARDIDSGNNSAIKYSLSSNQFFQVQQFVDETGQPGLQLVLQKKLDYESKTVHHVKLFARDLGEPSRSSHVTIRIRLIDANDNAPVFERRNYIASLLENLASGTEIAQVQAHDLDSGSNSQLSYHLVADPQDPKASLGVRLLAIDPATGAISLRQKLDREIHDGLQMQIEARDKGSPPLSSRSWLILQVEDVNDNLPVIAQEFIVTSDQDTGFISESSPNGTYVAFVSASDADNGPNGDVTLSIRTVPFGAADQDSEDSGHFVLANDGLIGTGRQFDRESQNRYKVIVSACDDGTPPRCAVSNLTVDILDENDNFPVFSQSVYDVTMSESDEVGSYVLTVSALDDDRLNGPVMKLNKNELVVPSKNGVVRYAIDQDDSPFSINSKTGRVTLVRNLDWEGKAHWKVPLIAIDGGYPEPKTGSSLLRVKVNDINDNPPLFKNPTFDNSTIFASILRSEVITTIQTIDYDSELYSQVELKILSIDGKKTEDAHETNSLFFILNPKSGDLRLNMSYMDLEGIVGKHHITIEASDSGVPSLRSRIGIIVHITDSLILPTVDQGRVKDSPPPRAISIQTLLIVMACILLLLIIVIALIAMKCRSENKKSRTYSCRAAEKGCGANPNLAPVTKPNQTQLMRDDDVASRMITSDQPEQNLNETPISGDVIKRKSAAPSRTGSSSNHTPQDDAAVYQVLTSVDRIPPPLNILPCDGMLRMSQSHDAGSLSRPPTHPLDIDSGRGESEVDTTSFGGTATREYERIVKNSICAQPPAHFASSEREVLNNMGRFCTEECRYYGHSDSCWMPSNDYLRPPLNTSRRGLETINERSPPYMRRSGDVQYQPAAIRARVKRNMFRSLGEPMTRPYRIEMENYHSEDLTQQSQYWPEDNGTPLSSVFSSTNPSPTPSSGQCATTFVPAKFKKSEGDQDPSFEEQKLFPKENYLSVACNESKNS